MRAERPQRVLVGSQLAEVEAVAVDVVDPAELAAVGGAATGSAAVDVPKFLALRRVFPVDLVARPEFVSAVSVAYDRIVQSGSRAAASIDLR